LTGAETMQWRRPWGGRERPTMRCVLGDTCFIHTSTHHVAATNQIRPCHDSARLFDLPVWRVSELLGFPRPHTLIERLIVYVHHQVWHTTKARARPASTGGVRSQPSRRRRASGLPHERSLCPQSRYLLRIAFSCSWRLLRPNSQPFPEGELQSLGTIATAEDRRDHSYTIDLHQIG
jgi:hypothetical protein